MEDIKSNGNGKFVTLTFSNEWLKKLTEGYETESGQWVEGIAKELEGYEVDNAVATKAIRLFLERWRKKHKKSLRHWLITELGGNGTENVHLHGIVWTDEKLEEVERAWKHGFVWRGKMVGGRLVNYVNESTVNYLIKYVTKIDEIHKEYRGVILTSAGIGRDYMEHPDSNNNRYAGTRTNETYRSRTGHRTAIPIYWRNKIYSEEEREELWKQKLDRQTRYVGGQKIDISKSEKDYYRALKHYRALNIELGYKDGLEDKKEKWLRQRYEESRRNMLLAERLKDREE